jgi:hypothetical protein
VSAARPGFRNYREHIARFNAAVDDKREFVIKRADDPVTGAAGFQPPRIRTRPRKAAVASAADMGQMQ